MRNGSLFANPSFRAHLVWVTTGFTAALLVLGAAAAFLPLFQRFDEGVGSDGELKRLTFEILDLHARLWPVIGVSLVSTLVCSWALNARMRRPLFRFVSAFRAISAGRVPAPLVIRATDYVQDECAELNTMLTALRERELARSLALTRVEERAATLCEWASAQGHPEAVALANELEAECKALDPDGGRV